MAISKPTAQSVINITGTALTESVVSSIIDDAELMAKECIKNEDSDKQEAVLRWLSAHLVTVSQGGTLISDKLGDASQSYSAGELGDGLKSTMFGQQAIALSPCISRLGRSKASVQPILST